MGSHATNSVLHVLTMRRIAKAYVGSHEVVLCDILVSKSLLSVVFGFAISSNFGFSSRTLLFTGSKRKNRKTHPQNNDRDGRTPPMFLESCERAICWL